MSSFLSNKFLQNRNAIRTSRVIENDVACVGCGYNLRGLVVGRRCPECGHATTASQSSSDMLAFGSPSRKKAMRLALTVAAACLVGAAVARFWLFFVLLFSGWALAQKLYLWFGLCACVAWIAGAFILTQTDMDHRYQSLRWLRRSARWMQFLWLPGYALWMLAVLSPAAGTGAGEVMYFWSVVFRSVAGIGVLLLAAWLMRLADDAELENAARWFNVGIWMLPLPTLLLAIVPSQLPWIFMVLIGMILMIWCWLVFMMGRSAWIMQRHVSWSMRLTDQMQSRDVRIAQTRTQLQREAESQVRPLGSAPIKSEEINVDLPCPYCGYNLRGLPLHAKCPECGQSGG